MIIEKMWCCECDKPATWIRDTQFAGKHPYCTEHAEKEDDFGRSDSYFSWDEIPAEQIVSKHKIAVEGYENLSTLTECILRLRYDRVEEFFQHSATELRQQAVGDKARGRTQLASFLDEAAVLAEQQQALFARIWALCEPHMKHE